VYQNGARIENPELGKEGDAIYMDNSNRHAEIYAKKTMLVVQIEDALLSKKKMPQFKCPMKTTHPQCIPVSQFTKSMQQHLQHRSLCLTPMPTALRYRIALRARKKKGWAAQSG